MFTRRRTRNTIRSAALLLATLGMGIPPFAKFKTGDGGDAGGGGGGDTGAGGGDTSKGEQTDDKSGEPAEDKTQEPTVPKRHMDAVLSEQSKLKTQLKELAAKVAAAPSEAEILELRELKVKRAQEEETRKKDAGKFEEILHKKTEEHQSITANLTRERDEARAQHREYRVQVELASHIPKYTTADVKDVSSLISPFVRVDAETNEFVIEKDGEWPMNPETGKKATVEEFVAMEIAKRAYFAMSRPNNGSGGGSQRGKGTGTKTWTEEEINNLSDADLKKHEKEIYAQMGSGKR